MTIAVILALVAFVATSAAVLASLRLKALSNERFDAALDRIDDHLGVLVDHVRRAVDRSGDAATGYDRGPFEPTLDLDRLLTELAREACSQCGADLAAVEVEGPDGEPQRAYFGDVPDPGLVNATLRSVDSRPFQAMTIEWAHRPTADADAETLASALVVPVLEDDDMTGAVGVYARARGAFDSEQARALEMLVDSAAPAIANARRFARSEQRTTIDDSTGVRNRKGYAEELDREVARCRRTGRPLSLVIVGIDRPAVSSRHREGLWELACLMTDTTRATDVVCRRGDREFAFLLPETNATGAGTFLARLTSEAASHAFALGRPGLVGAGLAEWRSGDSGDALDRRAQSAMSPLPATGLQRRPERPNGAPAGETLPARPRPGSPTELLERLGREIERAEARSASLALLLLGTAEPEDESARRRSGDVLPLVAERLDDRSTGGVSTYRTEDRELAVVLPGMQADAATGTFVDLRESVRERPLGGGSVPSLFAGVTSVAPGDDPESLLDRARQALWQARQAGAGTVVVATMGGSTA